MISIVERISFATAVRPRKSPAQATALSHSIPQFFSELHVRNVPYALVGDLAMLQYVETRNGPNIELIADAKKLCNKLQVQTIPSDYDYARIKCNELMVNVFDAGHPLLASILTEHSSIQCFAEGEIPCATVDGLFMLCLYRLPSLYRSRRFDLVNLCETDIWMLLDKGQRSLESILDELEPHLSTSDMGELLQSLHGIAQRWGSARTRFRDT